MPPLDTNRANDFKRGHDGKGSERVTNQPVRLPLNVQGQNRERARDTKIDRRVSRDD